MTAMPDTDSIRQLQVRLEQMQSRRADSVPREVADFAGRFAAMLEALNGPAGTPGGPGAMAGAAGPGAAHGAAPAMATLIVQGGFDSVAGGDATSAPAPVASRSEATPRDMLLGGNGPVDARWMAMLLADD
ncbi:hypothetical protein [Azospirillum halopraeferens]|uniref:hypothetical protein n=1 Tax=Azospirillum halopraeferens TaxID=34010 RepID=UPI000419296C|nr:hypothetical protein [Azospirillum halopraeferens]